MLFAKLEDTNSMLQKLKKWKVGWGITNACNMNCSFCYSAHVRKDQSVPDLPTLCNFIDNNGKYIEAINYGTGENTLVPYWFSLIEYIRKHYPKIPQALTTNGHLANIVKQNKKLRRIVTRAIDEIDVSLDYADPPKHNLIRGNENAYQWVLDTLQFCKDENIPATIVMIGLNETLTTNNLSAITDIALSYNALLRINIYRPTNPKVVPPAIHQLFNALVYLVKNFQIATLSDPLFSSIFLNDNFIKDPSGTESLRILPNGSITPSTYLTDIPWRAANISDEDILARISESQVFKLLSSEVIPSDCKNCVYENSCRGGAKDRRILFYNSLSKRDPYCPFRPENKIDVNKLPCVSMARLKKPVSIHDGYLPTLIFRAKIPVKKIAGTNIISHQKTYSLET